MKKPLFQGRVFVETPFLSCMLFGIWLILIKSEVLIMTAVADPDLQIRGPRSSRPRHKGWGGRSEKKNSRLFWPQFGLKIRRRAPRAPPLDPPLDWNAPAGQLWQMETTPGLTHNAAGPKGACPRDSWPYVFLFSSQGKRKPAGILIYKTSYILVIIPSVATYATHLVTCLFYKNSQCHLDPPPPQLSIQRI